VTTATFPLSDLLMAASLHADPHLDPLAGSRGDTKFALRARAQYISQPPLTLRVAPVM